MGIAESSSTHDQRTPVPLHVRNQLHGVRMSATWKQVADAQTHLAKLLVALSKDENERNEKFGAGCTRILVALVGSGTSTAAAFAAEAIGNLVFAEAIGELVRREHTDAVRKAGATPLLVALLGEGAGSAAAENAAGALWSLALNNDTNREAIRKAGGIPPLVTLLAAAGDAIAAKNAAGALWNLMLNSYINCEAIREAGGIPPLVALLAAGGESVAAENVVGALWSLASDNDTNCDAIREAGGIPPLVALLGAVGQPETAENAAGVLYNLAVCRTVVAEAVLDALPSATPAGLANDAELLEELQAVASSRLEAAEAGSSVSALERAIERGQVVRLEADTLQRAGVRLADLNGEVARKAKRDSLGLEHIPPPNEFICPITYDVMRNPVVASDGNSYERVAIEAVLRSGNGLSPLTREPLRADVLISNRNLRQRIAAYEGEMLDIASQAVEVAAGRAVAEVLGEQGESGGRKRPAEPAAGAASSSAGGAAGGRPKRSRH